MNYRIKTDLRKVPDAFVARITGNSSTKDCICIPLDSNSLYTKGKGIYLNLTMWETPNSQYGDSHRVNLDIDYEISKNMSKEDRYKAEPILGNASELGKESQNPAAQPIAAQVVGAPVYPPVNGNDGQDLPF